MGDSSPIDLRRRYARPGEFEVPSSVLESNAFKQRLGGQLNSDRTNPAPPSRQLTAGEVSNPVRRDPAPPASEARVGADRDQQLRNAVPLSREVRGGESHLRRNPAPVESEARLSVNLQQHPRSAVPVSRQLLPGGESQVRKNPAPVRPVRNDARFAADAQQHPRSAVPVSRQLPRGGESHLRRDLAPARPVRNDARFAVDAPQYRRNPAPLATRDAIAKRRTAARFELLPDPEPRWNRIGVSAAAQLAFLGLLLLSPMIFPQQMQTALKYDVTEILQPVTHIEIPHPTPPPPPPKVKPKVQPKPIVPKPKPVEVQPPQLNPKQPHVFLVLKPQLPKVHVVEAKPVDLKPIFAQAEIVLTSNQPKRPKEVLKAPILQPMRKEDIQAPGLGFGLPATVVAAASKVQTWLWRPPWNSWPRESQQGREREPGWLAKSAWRPGQWQRHRWRPGCARNARLRRFQGQRNWDKRSWDGRDDQWRRYPEQAQSILFDRSPHHKIGGRRGARGGLPRVRPGASDPRSERPGTRSG